MEQWIRFELPKRRLNITFTVEMETTDPRFVQVDLHELARAVIDGEVETVEVFGIYRPQPERRVYKAPKREGP